MKKKKLRIFLFAIFICVFLGLFSFITVLSKQLYTIYPTLAIQPTFYTQAAPNWCGPSVLQSDIQYVNAHKNPTPFPVPTLLSQLYLWSYMKNNTCGHDHKLYGSVGDYDTDVRKMNIAYDFGADPHALAWTMYNKTPAGYYYRYWVYYDSCDTATRGFLYTVEKYHEPVAVAVGGGSHFVAVTGYDADHPAYPEIPGAGTIYTIYYNDPLFGPNQNKNYTEWCNYFTPYIDSQDPDPATGWYAQKTPNLWYNQWVTVERDSNEAYNPDYGWWRYENFAGPILPQLHTSGPHDDRTEDNWFSPTNIGTTQSTNWVYAGPTSTWGWAANRTLTYSNDYQASYSFTFNGSSITRLYTMYYNRGLAQITLDGIDIEKDSADIDNPNYAPFWQVGKTWQVSPGQHTIQVTNLSSGINGYFDLDEFIVDINTPPNGIYDDYVNSPVVYYGHYSSDWTHSSGWGENQYKGTVSWNNTSGDGLRFTFLGNSVTYYYNTAYNQGYIGVVIDGDYKTTIDAYSDTVYYDVSWSSGNLGYGIHTIELTNLGLREPSVNYIELDKFVVQ